jgi:hypothetical protein
VRMFYSLFVRVQASARRHRRSERESGLVEPAGCNFSGRLADYLKAVSFRGGWISGQYGIGAPQSFVCARGSKRRRQLMVCAAKRSPNYPDGPNGESYTTG